MNTTYKLIDIIKRAHELMEKWRNDNRLNDHYHRKALVEYVEELTGFTLHFGGECPVDPKAKVDTVFRSGEIFSNETANLWEWDHWNSTGDILAFCATQPKVDRSIRGLVFVISEHSKSVKFAKADGLHDDTCETGPVTKWDYFEHKDVTIRKLTPDDLE